MHIQANYPSLAPLTALKLLKGANVGLALFFAIFCITVLVCYPFESYFSIPLLVASHMTMIVTSALIKIAYVTRCVALKQLNREVA